MGPELHTVSEAVCTTCKGFLEAGQRVEITLSVEVFFGHFQHCLRFLLEDRTGRSEVSAHHVLEDILVVNLDALVRKTERNLPGLWTPDQI